MVSDTFAFLVGPEARRITLHSRLVAHHSEPLNVLINGPMSEARQNYAVLKDVDEDTFLRFCQYAYTGNYDDDDDDDDDDATAAGTNADDHTTLSKDVQITGMSGIFLLPNLGFFDSENVKLINR